jgi:hypothetical protein
MRYGTARAAYLAHGIVALAPGEPAPRQARLAWGVQAPPACRRSPLGQPATRRSMAKRSLERPCRIGAGEASRLSGEKASGRVALEGWRADQEREGVRAERVEQRMTSGKRHRLSGHLPRMWGRASRACALRMARLQHSAKRSRFQPFVCPTFFLKFPLKWSTQPFTLHARHHEDC